MSAQLYLIIVPSPKNVSIQWDRFIANVLERIVSDLQGIVS
jgi:hypothetical protein